MAVQDIEIFTGLIALFKGETEQLTWRVLPEDASNKGVTFTVLDPSVCTISDSGLVTAIGNGKTEVIIRSVETPSVHKSFWVNSSVRVETLTLKEHTLQLSVGETHSIPVIITPDDASDPSIIWENEEWDNPCININPNTGLIEAIADGTDVVYATAESNIEATDQCSIKVWTDVQSIIVYPTTIEMGVGDTATLNYMIFPDNASNPNVIITVDDPTIVNYTTGISDITSHVESQEVCCAYTKADPDYAPGEYLFDNNPNTYWHTDWQNCAFGHDGKNHWVEVTFDEALILAGFNYKPRPSATSAGSGNGKFLNFKISLYNNANTLIHTEDGAFTYTNILKDSEEKQFRFASGNYHNVKKVHIEITRGYNNNTDGKLFASGANLTFLGAPESSLQALKPGSTLIHIKSIDNPQIESICQIIVYSEKEPDELDYNKNDRIIQWKAEIYFDGKNKDPLIVSHENYLIDADLLEETSSDSKTPFGNVSSNEFNMTLLNENGMFSPTREDSPYYGKIKKGVPIHVFCRPSDRSYVTWDEFGWFYVTDWTAAITGIKADITANDQLYNIFDMPMPKLPVQADKTFAQSYQEFFDALQEQVKVDESLTETLKYFYNTRENKDFLSEISTGAQAYVYCDRDGIPKVQYSRVKQEVAHTLTDSDQIISISSKQSAILDYDGAEVVMNMPQESDIETLLSVKSLTLPVGKYTSAITNFSKKPVFKVTAAFLTGVENAHVTDIIATCMDVIYEVQNDAGKEITNALEILGTFIDIISTNFADEGNNLLKIDNDYVQTEDYAQKFRIFLRAYVFNKVPVLELSIRGNVKYKLGEKLHVISERYAVDFTGVLIRQNFHYDGGMSCTVKLLNSEILEV